MATRANTLRPDQGLRSLGNVRPLRLSLMIFTPLIVLSALVGCWQCATQALGSPLLGLVVVGLVGVTALALQASALRDPRRR